VPKKLDRCVSKVRAKGKAKNPWAVCNAALGKKKTAKRGKKRG
jgi:hypothetical protein